MCKYIFECMDQTLCADITKKNEEQRKEAYLILDLPDSFVWLEL